jgi:hypothetical protein
VSCTARPGLTPSSSRSRTRRRSADSAACSADTAASTSTCAGSSSVRDSSARPRRTSGPTAAHLRDQHAECAARSGRRRVALQDVDQRVAWNRLQPEQTQVAK